jgi:hypothetical protein
LKKLFLAKFGGVTAVDHTRKLNAMERYVKAILLLLNLILVTEIY